MSASHHNVTCAAGEWEASNTFSMIARRGDFQMVRTWHFMAFTFATFQVSSYTNWNSSMRYCC